VKPLKRGEFDMPPVVAVIAAITAAQWITIGVAVISAVAAANQAKRNARRMEEEMRRQYEAQEAAERLASQQALGDSGGISGGIDGFDREDTKIMVKSSKAPRTVVFGTDRVSGPMIPFFSYEQNSILYHRFGVVLAGHECAAIQTVYFGDDPLTLDSNGWVISPAKYTHAGRPLFLIEKHLGSESQVASTLLIEGAALSGNPLSWDSTRRGVGCCYVVVHMEAHFDTLKQIGLPNVSAIVSGVKAYDPRTGLTAYTENPAILARWWLVDSIYCPTTLADEIDLSELIASANVCDESVEFSAGVFGPRYTCNGTINTNANPLDNLSKLYGAMDGDVVWVAGKWQIIAGYYKAPTLSIDESKLGNGQITISPYTPTANLVNAISGQFKGSATKYQAAGYGIIAPPIYQVEDGDQLYERKDDFDLVNDGTRCQMIAWQRLSRARQQLAISLDCNLKAYNASPLQNVTVSLSEFGYSNKVFSVRRRLFAGAHVEYQLQETGPEVWDWDYSQTQAAVEIPNINVQVSATVEILKNVAVSSGTESLIINTDGTIVSRMHVTWDKSTSYFVLNGGQIEWQYRLSDVGSGAGAWLNAPKSDGNAVDVFISPVVDGATYDLRGRAVSQTGTRGPSTQIFTHTVIGKIEPPSDVQAFTIEGIILNWLPVTDVDLAGYELRYNYGSNIDWGMATPLSTGLITESPFSLVTRPNGIVTLMIKAIDTTGNYSKLPASIFTNLGDPEIANIVETINFDPLFLGTIDGASVISGDLIAGDLSGFYEEGASSLYEPDLEPFYAVTDSFYDDDDSSFYKDSLDPFYPIGSSNGLIYTTNEVYIGTALTGSFATLIIDYEGASLFVEYMKPNSNPFYGIDNDSFYGDAASEFYPGTGEWLPWPGQISVTNDIYQFRVTIGAGTPPARINAMSLVIDAKDIYETIDNVVIGAAGTIIPYTKDFTSIKNIQATLQANGSGAVTVEIDKSVPLAPFAICYNAAHTAVAGASVDFSLKGY
jgi:hypothetical protein